MKPKERYENIYKDRVEGNTKEHFRYLIESLGCCCANIQCRICSIYIHNKRKNPHIEDVCVFSLCMQGAWDILEEDFPEIFLELKLKAIKP